MIKLKKGLYCEAKIPDEETLEAMEDARLGRNLEEWESVDAFIDKGIGQECLKRKREEPQ
ncbi:MAG: hypothetical protein GTO45_15175 [Candidatus Aminicenantes bacterium]|nr:hypothetical protein [Candidatus Aminicenantes bacterium]NIM80111.1 hypothetical protein [Candidatus Aminicenantes bacterium]NIN19449.1 hypothetical protein [Candidatus Aminicenantes bacterium]NIN43348.1 hypothetical protein [Candidatus Aminicenantes bacterium]NIN86093.1 hypothetical protein [Candidatus Aminicenantes bacterium]